MLGFPLGARGADGVRASHEHVHRDTVGDQVVGDGVDLKLPGISPCNRRGSEFRRGDGFTTNDGAKRRVGNSSIVAVVVEPSLVLILLLALLTGIRVLVGGC